MQAISFLSVQSKPVSIQINPSNHHDDFYLCCSSNRLPGQSSFLDRCAAHRSPAAKWSLPQAVANDVLERRAKGGAPVCVSFQFVAHARDLPSLLDKQDAEFRRSGVRPAAISINPGVHSLEPGFDLDILVNDLRVAQRRCAALFRNASAPPPPPACIFHTTAYTSYRRSESIKHKHSRHYSNIRGYNAAAAAAWAMGGMPLIDAGALSLLPPVINTIDRDGIHYQSDGNPFNLITWQMMLHTVVTNQSLICERPPGAGEAGGPGKGLGGPPPAT